jgi:hypothetical protein
MFAVLGGVLLLTVTACSNPAPPKADPDSAKKEQEDLNNARKKEWK